MTEADKKIRLIGKALEKLSPLEKNCALCPRNCRVDRTAGEKGVCQTGSRAAVSHALLHFGEEPVLSGTSRANSPIASGAGDRAGSGTIFFTGCNLKCLYCQNYQLSWLLEGEEVTDEELAGMMLGLQAKGALNINLVSPTHVVLPILRALEIAYGRGLIIPLVYNSNGYDRLDVVCALEGIVDIYLPDLKYRSPAISKKYSGAADYFEHASAALREMSVQQPVLTLGPGGNARRGLIVRHLVLPSCAADSAAVLEWVRENLSPLIGLSLMSQYHPCFKALGEIRRSLTAEEYRPVADLAVRLGFEHLFLQPEPFAPDEHLVPDFRKKEPFRWKGGR
jgi:putative pyruvate formate lyase activating enzyme